MFLALAVASTTAMYAEATHDLSKSDQLKEGVSTKKDAMKMLGKPMKDEKMSNGCSMCTWSDGKMMVTMMFGPDGMMQDMKMWKGGK
jgi:hypothetical protein